MVFFFVCFHLSRTSEIFMWITFSPQNTHSCDQCTLLFFVVFFFFLLLTRCLCLYFCNYCLQCRCIVGRICVCMCGVGWGGDDYKTWTNRQTWSSKSEDLAMKAHLIVCPSSISQLSFWSSHSALLGGGGGVGKREKENVHREISVQ